MIPIIAFYFLMNNSYAWEITSSEGTNFLRDDKLQVREEILSHPTNRSLEIKELDKDIIILTYLENQGGTKTPSETYNCAAYAKRSKKILFKDLACRDVLATQDGKKETEEASFKIKGRKIFYTFDDIKKTFDLPK
jgi:hypothetical protein